MGTLNDNFNDNSLNTTIWDEIHQTGFTTTVVEQNGQIELTTTAGGGGWVGIITDITYDMSEPSSVQFRPTKVEKFIEVGIVLTHNLVGNPYFENDWLRVELDPDGTLTTFKRKVSGTVTTEGTIASATVGVVHKIDFPATGNDVRWIIDGVEQDSMVTYPLASRNCYLYAGAWIDSAAAADDEADFDDFSATYIGGVSSGVSLLQPRTPMQTLLTR